MLVQYPTIDGTCVKTQAELFIAGDSKSLPLLLSNSRRPAESFIKSPFSKQGNKERSRGREGEILFLLHFISSFHSLLFGFFLASLILRASWLLLTWMNPSGCPLSIRLSPHLKTLLFFEITRIQSVKTSVMMDTQPLHMHGVPLPRGKPAVGINSLLHTLSAYTDE
ncbi:hypothetical protein HDV63DRAFT_380410 [Trichoderma sp. SZMC 28014]